MTEEFEAYMIELDTDKVSLEELNKYLRHGFEIDKKEGNKIILVKR